MKQYLFLIIPILCSSVMRGNNSYFFQNVSQNADLSYAGVNTVCEDANGYIWFGTKNGLYHHNTIKIKKVNLLPDSGKTSQNIRINKLYKDAHNTLWVCSQKGLFKYQNTSGSFEKQKLHFPNGSVSSIINNIVQVDSLSYLIHANQSVYWFKPKDCILKSAVTHINGGISYLHKDENDLIYLGTNDGKIYLSQDRLKNTKLLYTSNKPKLTTICKGGDKYYIGYLGYGVDIVNAQGIKIGELNNQHHGNNNFKASFIRQILKRKNGEIWIASHGGLTVVHNGQQTVLDSRDEIGLPHLSVYCMYVGEHDNIWVGTFSGGLACYSAYNYAFKYIPIVNANILTRNNTVTTFFEDEKGQIWIGSDEDGGIKRFDPTSNTFIRALNQNEDKKTKGVSLIASVGKHLIAIGMVFNKKLKIYDYKKNKLVEEIEFPKMDDLGVLSVHAIDSRLWVSGRHKAFVYNPINKETKQVYSHTKKGNADLRHVYMDEAHNLWFCTARGLYVKERNTDEIVKCNFPPKPFDLGNAFIYTVCKDDNGHLWVGTKGKGLYIYSPESHSTETAPDYNITDQADIYSLIKDKQGNIWYNTNKGLYQYDVVHKRTTHYGSVDGIPHTRTRANSALCSSKGELYFGTKGGFNIIAPNIIQTNPHPPKVKISSVSINNQTYPIQKLIQTDSTNKSLPQHITLNHKQNTLSFKLICNNYIKSTKNRFKYRLNNYNSSWVEIGHDKDIVFTKIPPGNYLFEAHASNNDGVWSTSPYQVKITITPPPYLSWYAILLYLVISIAATLIIYRELKSKIKLKKTITEERYKAQVNEFIYSERVKFFTNLSHELRTPLTLIISPIRTLMGNKSSHLNSSRLLKTIDRNANRLLKIVDQSIDFRLLEIGKLQAHFKKHEIVGLVNDVYLCFEQQIMERKINFTFTSQFDSLETLIDGDMIEKIVYNLLSNAIKYTADEGKISLFINEKHLEAEDYENITFTGNRFTGKAIEIKVRDTGQGISPSLLPHIFERFTKGNNSHHASSGIGLHLCKEYSALNNGNIMLSSKIKRGSEFILNLPFNAQTTYKISKQKQLIKSEFEEYSDTIIQKISQNSSNFKHTVLIAEDNGELRKYLKSFLASHFKVITAKTGEEALKLTEDITPNILLTDVSMPGISGIELIKRIKENPNWGQISIVVMTAYAERKYQMESVLNGADAFLVKPIDESLLLAQINNIVEKQELRANNRTKKEPEIEEENFIRKVEKLVEKNLQNPEFEIKDILKELGVGRTTLARKLESETQLNPSGFIRDVRLRNAIKLIRTNKFNIDEIANYVGFNSTSYFISSFKAKYGMTPNEFKNS